jgi:two-component system, cell cycle sensor histidine kinase and response regulator CckA
MDTCQVRRVTIPVDGVGACAGQRTVLVVTADADLREAAERALANAGYHVMTAAHSGHATLACLQGARVDILVAGLQMDDVSGPRLAERLRRHHPGLQAVYLAEPGTPECEGVLVRPFTRDELLGRLNAAYF